MNLANKPSENLQNFLFSQNNDKNALNTALLKYFENFSNESRQLDSIYQLLSNGADSNVQSQNGKTPLMFSCQQGHLSLVKDLLNYKADVNIRDNNKKNALFYAIESPIMSDLIILDICSLLLNNNSDINIESNEGKTPLIAAVERNSYKIVDILLNKDALVNSSNKINGDTALHIAVRKKNKEIIKLLMKKFARLDIKNISNCSSLDLVQGDNDLLDFIKKEEISQNHSESNEINSILSAKSAKKPILKLADKFSGHTASFSSMKVPNKASEAYLSENSESNHDSFLFTNDLSDSLTKNSSFFNESPKFINNQPVFSSHNSKFGHHKSKNTIDNRGMRKSNTNNNFVANNKNTNFQKNYNLNLNNPSDLQNYNSNYGDNKIINQKYEKNNLKENYEIQDIDEENERLQKEIKELEEELNNINMNNEENSQSQSNEDLYNEIENKANFDNLNIIEIYLPTDQVVGELHDEILRFQEINILKNNKCLEDFRTKFCPRLDQVCLESLGIKPEIILFGSFATGLALPYSDFDALLNLVDIKNKGSMFEQVISRLENSLNQKEWVKSVERIIPTLPNHNQYSIIKLQLIVSSEILERKIVLSINDTKSNGMQCSRLIKSYLEEFKCLQSLCFILKEYIHRSMFSLYFKGVNSYCLTLLIIAFLQKKTKEGFSYSNNSPPLLGSLLIEFFYYFGMEMDYICKEIEVNKPQSWNEEISSNPQNSSNDPNELTPKLIIFDPLKKHINVGKSVLINKLKNAFSLGYLVLHQKNLLKSSSFYLLDRLFKAPHQLASVFKTSGINLIDKSFKNINN